MKKTAAIFIVVAAFASAESPAEIGIRRAQEQIEKAPDYAPYYNSLATAYTRRARETSDVADYQKAEEALRHALQIAPGNFDSKKLQVGLMIGRHEFAQALEAATELNKQVPDDTTVYGYLADANTELGNYAAAVEATQWMLNIRPGNVPGLTRAAHLRELHGDLTGAIDLMQRAYQATAFQESEDRAWMLTQVAHLYFVAGNLTEAETRAAEALGVFPNYHYALRTLAHVREAQHRYNDAVALLEQRYEVAPHAENLFALADAYSLAGREADAKAAFEKFERAAIADSRSPNNANHELVAYYVDFAHQPSKALEIATAELKRRHDLYTLDAVAWSYAATGDKAEAGVYMKQALATGVKDPRVLAHAALLLR